MRHDQDPRRVNPEETLDFLFTRFGSDNDRGSPTQDRGIKRVAVLPVAIPGHFRKPGLQAMLEVPDHDHVGHFQDLAGSTELPNEFDASRVKLIIQRSPPRSASAKQGSARRGRIQVERNNLGVRQRLSRKLLRRARRTQKNERMQRLRADRQQRLENLFLKREAAPRLGVEIRQQYTDAQPYPSRQSINAKRGISMSASFFATSRDVSS
ncbi:hypothetical protein [Bradyrhizobium sp.]|uniref:hypothetical protein n=1 Tax=Bradyrhizobium sp. TaxID=376 RepID=UPI002D795248|nr:hypothetical protein [Bradyrhizobium sp.]